MFCEIKFGWAYQLLTESVDGTVSEDAVGFWSQEAADALILLGDTNYEY